jgi:hypothetical protein
VHEEKSTYAKDVTASTVVNPASTTSVDDADAYAEKSSTPAASPIDANEDPGVAPNYSNDGPAPGQDSDKSSASGNEASTP